MKKEQLTQQFQYILDRIECDEQEFILDFDKINYFVHCFYTEYDNAYNRRQYPNVQDRLASYLSGLPSCLSLDYSYCDIIAVGKSWGYCTTSRKEDDFCQNWFNAMAFRVLQLTKIHGFTLR